MVVLDPDHRYEHVLDELHTYCGLVSSGCYLIVEDANLNGHPIVPEFGPGPAEALGVFLAESDDLQSIDRAKSSFSASTVAATYLGASGRLFIKSLRQRPLVARDRGLGRP